MRLPIFAWHVLGLLRHRHAYALVARTRLRVLIGYYRAKYRKKVLRELMTSVGLVFKETTALFTKIHGGLAKKPGYDEGQNYAGERTICWEAPMAILVYLADRPALALGVELRGKVLCIRQLQGAPRLPLNKPLQRWPQFMVIGCMEAAQRLNLREVRIYNADQNLSYHYPVFDLASRQSQVMADEEHRQRMRRRYEGTARQLKFKKQDKFWSWENPHYARSN